ncbi:hypothetical protein V5G99_06730 [Bibersteinia trehalosi]|uniref:hypothetical protein n=1 Tax=Bibersteinia trehalosi TaxID=47735 RepID=UPI003D26ADA3
MQARITFYKINRCGLYTRSKNGLPPQVKFGGIKELLADLSQWAIGKNLADTDVFKNAQNQGFCTYLADIIKYGFHHISNVESSATYRCWRFIFT